jgi:DNA-binding SARP family transcriptional activator
VYRLQGTSVGAWLEAGRHHLALRGAVRVDALELREAAALGNLERVAGLSKGVLLEGLGLPGAAEFETWLDAEREAFARLHRDSLGAVAAHLERRGDLRAAITTLERVVQFDPLQETPQRELMRLHWQLGERAEALARLSRLKLLLREELGLDPSAETLALEARIRGNVTKPACTELEDQLEVQRHALEHLRMARTLHAENAGTERVAFHLERALRPLERTLTRLLELRHAPLPQAAD